MSPTERDTGDVGAQGGLDRAAAILGAFDAAHRELTLAALVRPLRAAPLDHAPHRRPDDQARLAGQARRPLPDRQPPVRDRPAWRRSGTSCARRCCRSCRTCTSATRSPCSSACCDGTQVLVVEKITGHRADADARRRSAG